MRVGIAALGVGFQECHQSLKDVESLARNECGALTNSSGGQMQVTGKTLPRVSTSLGRASKKDLKAEWDFLRLRARRRGSERAA